MHEAKLFLYMVNDQTFDLLHCSPCPWGFHEYKLNFVLRFEGFVEFPVNTEDVFNLKPVKPDTDHSSTKSISESTSKESPKHNLPNKKEALNIAENNANKAPVVSFELVPAQFLIPTRFTVCYYVQDAHHLTLN